MNNLIFKNGQKTWPDISLKNIYKWKISIWKTLHIIGLQGLQLKHQWVNTNFIAIRMSQIQNTDIKHA
jgi:hypothetical protein